MNNHLVKGTPYFTDTKHKAKQFPYLNENLVCDVLVVGGGIDGIICAYNFIKKGINTVLIDKERVGFLSSSAATALLEYQLDEHAKDLEKYLTQEQIVACYKLGLSAIEQLDDIINQIGNHCNYSKRPTLVYTHKESEVAELQQECEFRQKNGFNVEFITPQNNPFNFNLIGGIYCPDGGAEFNPYLFSKQLVEHANSLGLKVFENTECVKVTYSKNGVQATTNYNYTISCKKVVCTTGYNTKLFSKKPLCKMYTSYSIVTAPQKDFEWHKKTLLHDNSNPYHYIRLTHDSRIIMGGEDRRLFYGIGKYFANNKYSMLKKYLVKLFPTFDNVPIEYKFCGAFGTTKNNLGVVGNTKDNPHLYYMLGYGANGIINAIATSPMLVDLYLGHLDPMLTLFSPDRKI